MVLGLWPSGNQDSSTIFLPEDSAVGAGEFLEDETLETLAVLAVVLKYD